MIAAAKVVEAFDFAGPVLSIEPHGLGRINASFVVTAGWGGGTRRFLVQRINTSVFTDPVALMENIVAVTTYLRGAIEAQGGNPEQETMTVVPTREGAWFHVDADGSYWRAFHFVEQMVCHQMIENPAVFRDAARAFGLFAARLKNYPISTLHVTIPSFHDTRVRYAALRAALADDVAGRASQSAKEIEFALARQDDGARLMNLLDEGRLRLAVTHGDTKLNNVLMPQHGSGPGCVIDLDTVMPGLALTDIGDAIRYGANTADEEESDVSAVGLDMTLFRAFTTGYLETAGDSLTPFDKELLPWGVRTMALEQGVRFLADHLGGDVYYGVDRPGHNLDRCRNQFALVRDIESRFDEMTEVVDSLGR